MILKINISVYPSILKLPDANETIDFIMMKNKWYPILVEIGDLNQYVIADNN